MAAPNVTPTFSPFENLPVIVLEWICESLADDDPKRRSLFAFTLASKRCCAAAARERFKRIVFAVRDRQQLERDLGRLDAVIRVGGRARYVRQMKVTGRMRREKEYQYESLRAEGFEKMNERGRCQNDSDSEEDAVPKSSEWLSFVGSDRLYTEEEKASQNVAWRSLAEFTSSCTGLNDFIWASVDQIPLCILSTLHASLPKSRLHVQSFSLRSLYQSRDHPHDIHLDEYALATSPCLFSINAVHAWFSTDGKVVYTPEAVLQMVAGSAPRLSCVRMWFHTAGDSMALLEAYRRTRLPWQGFFVKKPKSSEITPESRGHLKTLAFSGGSSTSSYELQIWSNHTHFPELRRLELLNAVNLGALQTLTQLAQHGEFESLRKLALFASDHYNDTIIMDEAVSIFLSALSPLEDLKVWGSVSKKTMSTVLGHHGPALRKLRLPEELFSHEDVQRFRERCPGLYDMELCIRRTQGDDREVSMYRALGAFPQLERLSLSLYYSDHDLLHVDMRKAPDEQRVPRIRAALVNRAVDAELARSIFRVIYAANKVSRPGRSTSFRRLKLSTYGDGDGHSEFETILKWIGWSWVCERDWRDAHSENVLVRSSDEADRADFKNSLEEDLDMYDVECLKQAWNEVWPEQKGDWREHWHSFPLSQGF